MDISNMLKDWEELNNYSKALLVRRLIKVVIANGGLIAYCNRKPNDISYKIVRWGINPTEKQMAVINGWVGEWGAMLVSLEKTKAENRRLKKKVEELENKLEELENKLALHETFGQPSTSYEEEIDRFFDPDMELYEVF